MIGAGPVSEFARFLTFEKFSLMSGWTRTASNEVVFLRWILFSAALSVVADEQPTRHASAQPEAWHVGCFLTAVGWPRFDPRPEGKGAGVQNAGNEGSRWSPPACGRRLFLIERVFSVVRGCPSSRAWEWLPSSSLVRGQNHGDHHDCPDALEGGDDRLMKGTCAKRDS